MPGFMYGGGYGKDTVGRASGKQTTASTTPRLTSRAAYYNTSSTSPVATTVVTTPTQPPVTRESLSIKFVSTNAENRRGSTDTDFGFNDSDSDSTGTPDDSGVGSRTSTPTKVPAASNFDVESFGFPDDDGNREGLDEFVHLTKEQLTEFLADLDKDDYISPKRNETAAEGAGADEVMSEEDLRGFNKTLNPFGFNAGSPVSPFNTRFSLDQQFKRDPKPQPQADAPSNSSWTWFKSLFSRFF